MGYALGFAHKAIQDLDQILAYIACADSAAASRFKKALLKKVELLKVAPEMGVAIKRRADIRYIVYHSYLIFYYFDHDLKRVEVLRFWHSARDYKKISW